jgi:hypothetical protein
MSDEVTAVACHPNQPLLAVTCGNGVLHIWNYEMKLLMILREFNKLDDRSSSKASLAKSKVRVTTYSLLSISLTIIFNCEDLFEVQVHELRFLR